MLFVDVSSDIQYTVYTTRQKRVNCYFTDRCLLTEKMHIYNHVYAIVLLLCYVTMLQLVNEIVFKPNIKYIIYLKEPIFLFATTDMLVLVNTQYCKNVFACFE